MAIGPRLDLRQSQSLVMTPQLQQAIKLLQFSNIEVGAFIEEELERNPLLERDETSEPGGGMELPALDQRERVAAVNEETAAVAGERDYSDPDPPVLLHLFFGSHPTLNERIRFSRYRRNG